MTFTCHDVVGRREPRPPEMHGVAMVRPFRHAVTKLHETERTPSQRRPGSADFIFFNEQLASLASTGICLDSGLRQLGKDIQSSEPTESAYREHRTRGWQDVYALARPAPKLRFLRVMSTTLDAGERYVVAADYVLERV